MNSSLFSGSSHWKSSSRVRPKRQNVIWQVMQAKLQHDRWQVLWTVLLVIAVVFLIVAAVGGYCFGWTWTGFGDNKLWNWLDLLITPVALTAVGIVFSVQQSQTSLKAGEQQHRTDIKLADDRQQEATLEAFMDRIYELLLDKQLRASKPGDAVRDVARTRTLITLQLMDKNHKGVLLQFLHTAGLINRDKGIIDLHGANLREADLHEVDLHEANLSGTDLCRANLFRVNLSGARLTGAKVTDEQLAAACSLHGATLPDGSTRH